MQIAIMGAGGFLGRELLRQLSRQTALPVVAFTSGPDPLRRQFGECAQITVESNARIADFPFDQVAVLLNCAFPTASDAVSLAGGLEFLDRSLRAAVDGGVGAVVNISSQSVYSQKRRETINEQAAVMPETQYALGKYAAELLVNTICREIPHTNIRMASLVGVDLEQRLVNRFVRQVMAGEPITLTGGSQRFGYLDVRDAADGLLTMLSRPAAGWAEVYNLGAKGSYSLLEIAQRVQRLGEGYGFPPAGIQLQQSDLWQNSELDCSRFYGEFDWLPRYTLEDTAASIFEAEHIGRNGL